MSIEAIIPMLDYLQRPFRNLLDDPASEDIAVNGTSGVWQFARGAWLRHDIDIPHEDMESIAILAGSLHHQEIGEDAPILDQKIPSGHRLCAVLPPIVEVGSGALSYRRHDTSVAPIASAGERYHADGWNQWRNERAGHDGSRELAAYDRGDLVEFLTTLVEGRRNILFVGQTGVGKTTFAKSLAGAIGRNERVFTIEDTIELAGMPPNSLQLIYDKWHRTRADIGHEQLLQAAMRMRPDRIIVGEMRDDAVLTWIMETCTGHPGSITTIHGRNAAEAVRRIAHLISLSGKAGGFRNVGQLLNDTIDVIIPLHATDPAETGKSRGIGAVWFADDARRRGEVAANLLDA